MVLICNSPDKADQLLNGLQYDAGLAAQASAWRIAALVPQTAFLTWDALQQEPRYKAAKKALRALTDD
jgi:beta-N-acetylhexosaminidase